MVPLAILIARYVGPALRADMPPPGLRAGLWILAGFAAAVAIAALAIGIAGPKLASGDLAADFATARPYMGWLCAGAGAVAASLAWAILRGRHAAALAISVAAACVLYLGVDTTMAEHQPRSIKPIAETLRAIAGPDDEVAAYRTYPQDLPVYLGRRITVMGWSGELDFGRAAEPATRSWMFDDEAELWRRWNDARTVYLVVPLAFEANVRQAAGERFAELARTRRHLLAVNRAP
jgi:Aminoarabinose transferase C-terminal domain